jgi:hypothetical protein
MVRIFRSIGTFCRYSPKRLHWRADFADYPKAADDDKVAGCAGLRELPTVVKCLSRNSFPPAGPRDYQREARFRP